MGNKNNKYGGIVVQTDQPYYLAGGVVSGHVFINCSTPFQGTQLVLAIEGNPSFYEGKENSRWQVNRNDNDPSVNSDARGPIVHTGQNILYANYIVLYQFPAQTVMKGQYSFPFILRLHSYLPGTYFEQGPTHLGQIQYMLKAHIQSTKNTAVISGEQQLVIREPQKDSQKSLYQELTVEPRTWCCVSQGRSNIRCYFQKNSYLPGDRAFIICQVDNLHCNLEVLRIRCVLRKKLQLTSNEGSQQMFNEVITQVEFPGVAAHSSRLGEQAQRLSIDLVGKKQGQLIQPSTGGNIVKCDYELTVTSELSGCTCCTTMPSVTAQIKILAPPTLQQNLTAPTDWQPQQFEKQELVVSGRNSYREGMGANPYIAAMNSTNTLNMDYPI